MMKLEIIILHSMNISIFGIYFIMSRDILTDKNWLIFTKYGELSAVYVVYKKKVHD